MEDHKRKRKITKCSITRLVGQINTLVDNDDVEQSDLEVRLCRLQELFEEFNAIQTEIELLIPNDDDIQEEFNHRNEVEEKYFTGKAKIQQRLRNLNTTNVSNQTDVITNTLTSLAQNQTQLTEIIRNISSEHPHTSTPNVVDVRPKIQLPQMKIPTFNGNYTEWTPFIDMFNAVVHNNDSLSPVQKFQYLKQALTDEAASTLKHLQISEANYTTAYELLKGKYAKEDIIIEAHFQAIMNSSSIKSPSGVELRKLLNVFEENIRALKALNLSTDSWDPWINFLLISRLDKESQQLWRRESATTSRPPYSLLVQFIEKRIYELSVNKSMNK